MWRTIGAIVLGTAIGSAGMMSARAEEPKAEKHEIKGGIDGKVKKVDLEDKKLTIITAQGRERTFTITDETTMLGPRGGKVRQRLKDPRFYEGMALTIVAEGNTATEVHLGFQHRGGEKTASRGAVTKKTSPAKEIEPEPTSKKPDKTTVGKGKAASKAEDDDEDNEVPGQVKKFDATKHILVVSLLNGKDRSFLLSKEVKVVVKGATSKRGLMDPALKPGAHVEIVTDEGGHKVKEVKVVPAAVATRKKAG